MALSEEARAKIELIKVGVVERLMVLAEEIRQTTVEEFAAVATRFTKALDRLGNIVHPPTPPRRP